jgi:hypothetical protein
MTYAGTERTSLANIQAFGNHEVTKLKASQSECLPECQAMIDARDTFYQSSNKPNLPPVIPRCFQREQNNGFPSKILPAARPHAIAMLEIHRERERKKKGEGEGESETNRERERSFIDLLCHLDELS